MAIQSREMSHTVNRFQKRRQRVVVNRMILKITAYQVRKLTQTVPQTKMVALMNTNLQGDRRGVERRQIDMDIIFCLELFPFKI